MGNTFSGRWGKHAKKQTVENCYKLNIYDFLKGSDIIEESKGTFNYGSNFKGSYTTKTPYKLKVEGKELQLDALINLSYEVNGVSIESPLYITSTPANFGNKRYWVLCPSYKADGRPCLERNYKLYRPRNAYYFCCRECYKLTYQSVQTRDKRVEALRKDPTKLIEIITGTQDSNIMRTEFILGMKAYYKDIR